MKEICAKKMSRLFFVSMHFFLFFGQCSKDERRDVWTLFIVSMHFLFSGVVSRSVNTRLGLEVDKASVRIRIPLRMDCNLFLLLFSVSAFGVLAQVTLCLL